MVGPAQALYGGPSRGAHGAGSIVEGCGATSSYDVENVTPGLSNMRGAHSRSMRPMRPMAKGDSFVSRHKSQQLTLKGMINGARDLIARGIGKWWYNSALHFNAANSPFHSSMIAEIGKQDLG
ncbi:hypothetical protein AMTR_s00085p00084190 [Amborella trichopoda]|uniref:Uncharacterized protein n=1 Tax=Amborella trichopoda TaxID=13333 RepID=W1P531_AMBTC|nr:hypothetical protein AMTR_s00085p00084190 [Amborella trichopoda]